MDMSYYYSAFLNDDDLVMKQDYLRDIVLWYIV